MRKLTVTSSNIEVSVSGYDTYIDGQALSGIISENVGTGTFRAKVTIIIEEVNNDLIITGTKEKPKELEFEELE